MYMGHSSSRGIVIGDTALPAPNAVYGCWRSGEIVLEKGEFKELLKRQEFMASEVDAKIINAEVGDYVVASVAEIGLKVKKKI